MLGLLDLILPSLALSPTSSGPGSGSSSAAVLFDSSLGANAPSIDTGAGGIAGGFNILEVLILTRTDDAAAESQALITLNNDTGANYDNQVLSGNNVTASANVGNATANWSFQVHGAGGSAGYPGLIWLVFPAYAQTTFNKVAVSMGGQPDATAGNQRVKPAIVGWRNTAAISRLKVAAGGGAANLLAGSRLTILGR
jgi:hypothetical protein